MFHFFHKKYFLQIIILIGLLAILGIRFCMSPITFALTDQSTFIYSRFVSFLQDNLLWTRILLLGNIMLQLFLLHYLFSKNNFTDEKSFMPVIWYLFFLICCFNVNEVSPAIFSNLIIIILLILNIHYSPTNLKNNVTFSGILIAINSFIDVTSSLLLLFLFSAMLVSRYGKAKDIFTAFIGYLIPYIYLFTYYFFTDNLLTYLESYQNIAFFSLFSSPHFSFLHLIFASILFCAILFSFFIIKRNFDNKLIILRKRVIILALLLLISMLMILISNFPFTNALPYLFVPIVIYFSILHSFKKQIILNDILVIVMGISFLFLLF